MSDGNGKVGKLSPVQRKMLIVLSDFQLHWAEELRLCLWDDHGSPQNIHAHLTAIRKHLTSEGKSSLITHRDGRGNIRYVLTPLIAVSPAPDS